MASLLLLIFIIGFVIANPFPNTVDNRLVSQVQNASLIIAKNNSNMMMDEKLDDTNSMIENINTMLSILKDTTDDLKVSDPVIHDESIKQMTQKRKHKAIFVNYVNSLNPRSLHYPKISISEVDHTDNSAITTKNKLRESKQYQESEIYYIQLPSTPYMFVPGLGYVSQPPSYSTTILKSHLTLIPQLLQPSFAKPTEPTKLQLIPQQASNSVTKVPIDFVSNGKPTSVYQWQKKFNKKPIDSLIMNLDNLSTNFVNNGKPTSIYQWQANLKPIRKSDDSLTNLNLGPYSFNGKLTSVYLLGSDSATPMQSISYPDYQDV